MDTKDKFHFTVAQLISALKEMPQELPVVVSGYENGYENFFDPYVATMKHEPENTYYDGEFQIAKEGDKDTFDAAVLHRVVRDD